MGYQTTARKAKVMEPNTLSIIAMALRPKPGPISAPACRWMIR
jgi:hypothetical protein